MERRSIHAATFGGFSNLSMSLVIVYSQGRKRVAFEIILELQVHDCRNNNYRARSSCCLTGLRSAFAKAKSIGIVKTEASGRAAG